MRLQSDNGSIAPLAIGLVVLSVGLVLAVSAATSMFILQKRLTNFSESGALFIAETAQSKFDFLTLVGDSKFEALSTFAEVGSDSKTVHFKSCAIWRAPIAIIGQISSAQVCSHASARAE